MLLLNNSNNEELEKLISGEYHLANVDNNGNEILHFVIIIIMNNEQWLLKYLWI